MWCCSSGGSGGGCCVGDGFVVVVIDCDGGVGDGGGVLSIIRFLYFLPK